MADFHRALDIVLDAEGGFSLHPKDTGNYNSRGQLVGTKYGISAPLLEDLLRMAPSRTDMENLTPHETHAIYMVKFWIPIRGKEIRNQKLATVLFDGCVNHGLYLGVVMMQRSLKVSPDSIVGPRTIAALNDHPKPDELIEDYTNRRASIYANHRSASAFLRGWLSRIEKFLNLKNEEHV